MGFFRRDAAPTPAPAVVTVPARPPAVGTSDGFLALPTVYRCVQLLAHTMAALPVQVVQNGQAAATPEWLRRPEALNNGLADQRAILSGLVVDMAARGSGYLKVTPFGASWRLDPVPAAAVSVRFEPNTYRRVYTVGGLYAPVFNPATETTRSAGGLLPVPFLTVPDRPDPLGPLQAARLALTGYRDTDAWAAQVFPSGRAAGSGGRLETDQDISPETAARWQARWVAQQTDPLGSAIPVLGGGLRYVTDTIDPRDAQWIEARQFNAQEVARLFGVPPRYLGLPSGDSTTYATARDNDAAFLKTTLLPYVDSVTNALTALLPPGRTEAENVAVALNPDTLLRATVNDRYAAYTTALAAGFLTVDEVRAMESLPPLFPDTAPAALEAERMPTP